MKNFLILFFFIFFSNCSYDKNSKFWTKDVIIKKKYDEKLKKILEKSNNIMSLTFDEFKIYIDEYGKKNKYPDI